MSDVDTRVEKNATLRAKVGARVFLLEVDGKTEIGYGTFMGMVPAIDFLSDRDEGEDLEPDDPELSSEEKEIADTMTELVRMGALIEKFVLDSGEIKYGLEVYWRIIPEQSLALN